MPRYEFSKYVELMEEAFLRDQAFTIPVSGSSMEPSLSQGDAVTLVCAEGYIPKVGDILLYRRKNGQYVLHRAVRVNESTVDFCGDAQVAIEVGVPCEDVLAVVSSYEKHQKHYQQEEIRKIGLRRLKTRPLRRVYYKAMSYLNLSKFDNRLAVKYIFRYLKKHIPFLVIMCILSVLTAVATLGMAMVSGHVIDKAVENDMHNFRQWFIVLFGLLAVVLTSNIIYSNLRIRAVGYMKMEIREDLFDLLLTRSYPHLQQIHSGEYMNRFTTDIQIVVDTAVGMIPQLLSLLTKLVGGIAIMMFVEPMFTSLMIVVGIFAIILLQFASRYYKRIHKECQESEGKTRGFVQESAENLTIIKSFTNKKGLTAMLKSLQVRNYDKQVRRNVLSNIGNTAVYGGFTFAYYSGLAWGVLRIAGVIGQQMSIGVFTMFLQIMEQIRSPFKSASGILPQFYSMCASAERLIELEQLPAEDSLPLHTTREELYDSLQMIKFNHIDFAYDKKQPIFRDAMCKFRKGEFIAVVGGSGIGKSTLIKMLLGLLLPDKGSILLCTDEGEIPVTSSCRNLFCYAPQGNMVLSGTLLQNITIGCEEVSKEEILNAIHLACLDDIVSAMPKGVHTYIGERGIGLSEGQIQRLAVARALVSKAPVILLDESTSALDAATEQQLLDNLLSLKDRTILFISHKEAVVQKADRIFEIKDYTLKEIQKETYNHDNV